jgi:N-acetyl-1-D-myo-inositol-2-amino-2-deoxy-alpha-D-glucopyranoside deacetylase
VQGLMCVHPHPDDEAIACGGLLAASVDRGLAVTVVTCTRGEEGENLAGIDLGADDLLTHRMRELAAALAALGVDEHTFLGYRDSGMAGSPANEHPDAFAAADLYDAAARLARLVRRHRPAVVVSDDERGTYGHPDHVKAHRVTVRALQLAADPWWSTRDEGEPWAVSRHYVHTLGRRRLLAFHDRLLAARLASPFGDGPLDIEQLPFGVDDDAVTARLPIGPWLDRKRAAIAAHRSQVGADSFFLNVPDDLAEDLFAVEEFVLITGEQPRPMVDDLFAGID